MERMSLELVGRVAVLKFNHPEVMNAVGGLMLEDFAEAIAQIKARGSDTRCLLLTGEGRGFCKEMEAPALLHMSAHQTRAEIDSCTTDHEQSIERSGIFLKEGP